MSTSLSVNKKLKKNIGIIAAVFIFILILYICLGAWLLNNPKIFPNIFIDNINTNIGGLTSDEAKSKVDGKFKKQLDKFIIKLTHDDNTWELSCEDIDLYYPLDDSIKDAYQVGRDRGYIHGFRTFYRLRKKPLTISPESNYSLPKIENKINEISQTIEKPPVDAKIKRVNGNFVITKGIPGIEVDKEILKHGIIGAIDNLDSVSIGIDVKKIEPGIKEADLKDIRDLIGQSVTKFSTQNKGRAENIRIAAGSINNTVLMPGEEFSFNNSTGPRTAEAGYKEATVIVDGEFTPGIGGGVCQVSTTLYQSALISDMEITSRRNHGLPVGYVPMGQDATVAYGYIDLKFKNNKKYPVYIESFTENGRLHVRLYSKKTDNLSINLKSEILEVIEPKMQVKKDGSMYLSESKVIKNGKSGYRAITYKVYSQGGAKIKQELVSRDYYPPRSGIIMEGTKEEKPKQITEQKQPEQETEQKQPEQDAERERPTQDAEREQPEQDVKQGQPERNTKQEKSEHED